MLQSSWGESFLVHLQLTNLHALALRQEFAQVAVSKSGKAKGPPPPKAPPTTTAPPKPDRSSRQCCVVGENEDCPDNKPLASNGIPTLCCPTESPIAASTDNAPKCSELQMCVDTCLSQGKSDCEFRCDLDYDSMIDLFYMTGGLSELPSDEEMEAFLEEEL